MIEALDVPSIYEVPLMLHEAGLDRQVLEMLDLNAGEPDLTEWRRIVDRIRTPRTETRIAIVGKYIDLQDAYKSIIEAFVHAGVANDTRVGIDWVDSEDVEEQGPRRAAGPRPTACWCRAASATAASRARSRRCRYAREQDIPFFGICLGLQCAVIEIGRDVCGLERRQHQRVRPGARRTRSST